MPRDAGFQEGETPDYIWDALATLHENRQRIHLADAKTEKFKTSYDINKKEKWGWRGEVARTTIFGGFHESSNFLRSHKTYRLERMDERDRGEAKKKKT